MIALFGIIRGALNINVWQRYAPSAFGFPLNREDAMGCKTMKHTKFTNRKNTLPDFMKSIERESDISSLCDWLYL